jgi:transposase
MSLQPEPIGPVPDDTMRVAHAAFPKGNSYLRLRDDLGLFYTDEQFADLFPTRGQPAASPWRLALVLVLQFVENLTDRQAADAVRVRIDWTYLLGLELTDEGFDYSTLSEFRARLLDGDAAHRLLAALLAHCKERGVLKARGRQRTDATHVLAAIRVLNRVECVGEAMRHALNTLAVAAPLWLRGRAAAEWTDRYAHRVEGYRLPSGQAEREALALAIRADDFRLLAALWDPATPPGLRDLEAVRALRQMWVQQFYREEGRVHWRADDHLPPPAARINSPYDVEARYGTKRSTIWIGYKAPVTETCDEETPHLVTQVETTIATGTDYGARPKIQRDLARRALPPAAHFVDSGYVDADHLVSSAAQGIDLVGPAAEGQNWQGRAGEGFDLGHFAIDWEARQATCPGDQRSVTWKPSHDQRGHPVIYVEFARRAFLACPCRAQCTRAAVNPRSLTLRSQAQHDALQAARARQKTDAFAARYATQAGIEGTLSQAVRVFDLRRTRCIGHAKTHLQHILIATALNVARLADWCDDRPRVHTRPTPFVALMLEAA